MIVSLLIVSLLVASAITEDCNLLNTDAGSVCVCNSTYCDTVPDLDVSAGKYQIYSTSKAKLGFYSATGSFVEKADGDESSITVDQNTKYQTILGFGGAFTDSTGINIYSLPEEAQTKLIESYFGSSGIEYTFGRVPIGGTDFSTRGYSYDDVEDDVTLENFALQEDDLIYKIPYIQQANALKNGNLKLFATPWTAPTWMKTNDGWAGLGSLKLKYYQLWADYILKFFEEYSKQNITFWGMTPQNEPIDGYAPEFLSQINAMGWTQLELNQFIGYNLGPTIRNSSFSDLKIMVHDDNTLNIALVELYYLNALTMSYVSGAAFHWYANSLVGYSSLTLLDNDKEDWFYMSTEACSGSGALLGLEVSVSKGNWSRGEDYFNDILNDLEYGVAGWVDWNMALDETGGPTYIGNYVDSPILVNATLQEFYKQPMYYALGHFSKFVISESVRLATTVDDVDNVSAMAFLRPDNLTALVVYNSGDEEATIQIENNDGQIASIAIEARSINTVLYN